VNDARAQWLADNQRVLSAGLARVAALLARHADGHDGDRPPPEADDDGSALAMLRERFGLTPFERDVLLLAAGMELDGEIPALCARAHGDPSRTYPTFSLALAAFGDGAWSSLGPFAPLRYWRLVEVDASASLVGGAVRIDETILNVLTGTPHVDARLAAVLEPDLPVEHLSPSQRALVGRMSAVWAGADGTHPVLQLCGDDVVAKRGLAAAVADAGDLQLLVVRASALPSAPQELDAVLRLCERHAILQGACVLLECDDVEPGDGPRDAAVARVVERFAGPLVVGTVQRRRGHVRPIIPFDVARPTRGEQAAHWSGLLGDAPDAGPVGGRLAAQFDFPLAAIDRVWAAAGGSRDGAVLWECARAQARPRLDELAERIEPRAAWDDLVVPDVTRRALERIIEQIEHRHTVYDGWGFDRTERGLGIAALFAGGSGTGKTLAAEAIANRVGIDLYRIDLSAVVSKYIGETEKNLRRVFDAAEAGGAILLFDEADALFGRRSEVKDSHDRHANVEVSYLLQRVEAYRGLAILTTNMKEALDGAFARRLRFIVAFPFPDAVQREAIWRRVFPPATPTAGLDPAKLARLNVAGGNIHAIALDATFRAAAAGRAVTMSDLLEAARAEYRKLERTLGEHEIAGWAAPVRTVAEASA
jgi:ATPase family associated with various cellular activities (AAA)